MTFQVIYCLLYKYVSWPQASKKQAPDMRRTSTIPIELGNCHIRVLISLELGTSQHKSCIIHVFNAEKEIKRDTQEYGWMENR